MTDDVSENDLGAGPSGLRRFLTPAWIVPLALAVLAVAGGLLVGLVPVLPLLLVAVVAAGAVLLLRRRRRSHPGRPAGLGPVIGSYAAVGVVTLALIQLIPVPRDNPPVTGEPEWATPRTRELMVAACFDCHSNEVEYPWYSKVAPLSWGVALHVREGRDEVNYSEFDTDPGELDDTIEVILDGEMPPAYYTRFGLHPEANLTRAERDELIAGLRATPGFSEGDEEEHEEEDEDHDEDEDDD